MDMDPKGTDEGATPNNNDQCGHHENNGVDGMQLQAQQIEEIRVGSINIQLSPTCIHLSAQNLAEKKSILQVITSC
jgi:hypothetical protein